MQQFIINKILQYLIMNIKDRIWLCTRQPCLTHLTLIPVLLGCVHPHLCSIWCQVAERQVGISGEHHRFSGTLNSDLLQPVRVLKHLLCAVCPGFTAVGESGWSVILTWSY